MGANPQPLDNTIEIVTPENIAFRYQVAGPFRRLPAYLIDLAIRVAFFWVGAIVLSIVFGLAGLPGLGLGFTLVLWFALEWFYGGLFETFWNGQTPGKRLMRIRVLSIDGQPINGLQGVLRNVLRALDQQPVVFSMVGLVTATLNDRFQRMGDLACGTMVVIEEHPWFRGMIRLSEPEAIRLAGQIPPSFQPSRTMARALAAYVQRRANILPMRRLEIAWHLGEPLREQFDLPVGTDPDMLLCGLYQRTFITDWDEEPSARTGSPFRESDAPSAASEPAPAASDGAAAAVEAMAGADQGRAALHASEGGS
jgi:uncharacterized RDD family membrane protein YckC